MAYSFRRLAMLAGVRRKSITLRPLYMTLEQEAALAKATLAPVREWEASKPRLMEAYEQALKQYTADSAASDMESVILALDDNASRAVVSGRTIVEAWLASYASRHARQFANTIKSSIKMDPWPYINVAANADDIAAFQERIANLIKDISDTARKDISDVIWKSILNRTHPRQVAKDISEKLGIARKRALFIASDQANKVHSKLNQIRQEEAGFDEFMWETAKDSRVRPEHRALQGRVFKYSEPPSVGLPGTPIRCRCTAAAHMTFD